MKTVRYSKIYIDTNVIVNFFTKQKKEVDAMNYLFRYCNKNNLVTSSLALVQVVTQLQKRTPKRPAFKKDYVENAINYISTKLTILDVSKTDIFNGIKQLSDASNGDIEDAVHYAISQKASCNVILTNNTKDFNNFIQVKIVEPIIGDVKQRIVR